jgi:hypothetical protein
MYVLYENPECNNEELNCSIKSHLLELKRLLNSVPLVLKGRYEMLRKTEIMIGKCFGTWRRSFHWM